MREPFTTSNLYKSSNQPRLSDMSALRFELSWTWPNLKDLNKYSKTKLNRKDPLKVILQNYEGLRILLPLNQELKKQYVEHSDAPTGEWDPEKKNKGCLDCSLELCVCLFKHKPAWIMLSQGQQQEKYTHVLFPPNKKWNSFLVPQ